LRCIKCSISGAEYVGLGLIAASVKASEWLYRGTELLKDKVLRPALKSLKGFLEFTKP
jgi:hypothetical protein